MPNANILSFPVPKFYKQESPKDLKIGSNWPVQAPDSYLKLGPKDKLDKGRVPIGKRRGRETARTRQGKLMDFFHKQPQYSRSVTHL